MSIAGIGAALCGTSRAEPGAARFDNLVKNFTLLTEVERTPSPALDLAPSAIDQGCDQDTLGGAATV
jgi:hypothetical protein